MPEDINFCQRCGHRLGQKEIEKRLRPHCPGCGFIVFMDPKVAAVVLVTMDGKLVMVRRGVEPALGSWAFPSGFVDRGEVVEHAAKREVKEETGLDVELDCLVGLYSRAGSAVMLAVFAAHVVGGSLQSGHDAQDVALFAPDTLPPLPFPHDAQILQDWKALNFPPD